MAGEPPTGSSEPRATWLVLAADGPALDLELFAPTGTRVQTVADPEAHPGRAYTRRQLLDRVWGPDQVGDPRTIDVHIRWLRSKIELQPDHPVHLVTIRGVGYRLDRSLTES